MGTEEYTRKSLEQIKLSYLRKLLRRDFPECRGAFAARATKEHCIDIILKEKTPGEVAIILEAQEAGGKLINAASSVNKAGEEVKAAVAAVVEVDLNKALDAMAVLSPHAVKGIRQAMAVAEVSTKALIEAEKELKSTRELLKPNQSVVIGKDGKTIKIIGKDFPLIGSKSQFVPPIDDNYNFKAWQAKTTCGAVVFTQDAADLIKAVIADYRVQLVGPPAVGKTSIITQLGANLHWPVSRFNFNQDLTVEDFVGSYEAVTETDKNGHTVGVTKWVHGIFPMAMKEGHILILDELDHAPAECTSIIHSVLEPHGKLVITANGGEVITPHEKFRMVATSNTAGFGDSSGIHPNAKVQDAALLSRFDVIFHVDWMKQQDEVDLLRKITAIDEKVAAAIAKIAKDSRSLYAQGKLQYPITLRQTLAWAQTISLFGLSNAFAVTVLGKLPPCDVGVISEVAQRHLGEKLDEVLASSKEGGE